jgi:hypothetical protein
VISAEFIFYENTRKNQFFFRYYVLMDAILELSPARPSLKKNFFTKKDQSLSESPNFGDLW